MPQASATFIPGGPDDFSLPEVISPSPQRVTPHIPQDMQDDLQRLELGGYRSLSHEPPTPTGVASRRDPDPPGSANTSLRRPAGGRAYPAGGMDREAPSFSPFPKVTGDQVPPADDVKEDILWNARKHVLHSQNVSMQISWARDALIWVDIAADAAAREPSDKTRPATPRVEHELRKDAINIINYLARQEHPDALYIRAKWFEFGKFGTRIDKREAHTGYKRAAELGHARSEYRLGMLFEQSNDMAKAKEHYYKGMSAKDSATLYRMGMMSLLGQHGESKDFPRGLERIQAAADDADEDAPQGSYVYGMLVGRDLPDIYIPEGLLPVNLETAKMYVEKAAYLGFAKAQLKMGQAYELCQLGCDFKPTYSLHYYGLAAKQGLPEAALGISRWFLFGFEGVFRKNEELAFKYAHEAASAKLPIGEFAIGYYYEIGIHVSKSISEARKWYQLAAENGNKDAHGRLDSRNQDKSLSKQDHETTTLTRIKSQHGSQRGKRPERFMQTSQQMPTLKEGSAPSTPVEDGFGHMRKPAVKSSSATASPRVSPQPSPGIRPTIVSEKMSFPDPSRASVVSPEKTGPLGGRLDAGGIHPARPHSAAPYPDDDHRPSMLHASRSRSTAPYPEDDVQGAGPYPNSAFGMHTAGPRAMPTSQSAGNLHQAPAMPPHRSRVASAGPVHGSGRPYAGDDGQGRPLGAQPYPAGHWLQKQGPRPQGEPSSYLGGADPGREYGSRPSSRPGPELPPLDPRMPPPNQERFSRVPGVAGRLDRLGPGPLQDPHRLGRVSSGLGPATPSSPGLGPGRTGSAPPGPAGQSQVGAGALSLTPGPSKPSKGPATFEDMGIPQGKQEGDCVGALRCIKIISHSREANTGMQVVM